MTTTKTDTKNDLTELSESMARLMGWQPSERFPLVWQRNGIAYGEVNYAVGFYATVTGPPRYAESWALMQELTEWLEVRGYSIELTLPHKGMGWAHVELQHAESTEERESHEFFKQARTMPEALCLVIRRLVDAFPELAAPVVMEEGKENG